MASFIMVVFGQITDRAPSSLYTQTSERKNMSTGFTLCGYMSVSACVYKYIIYYREPGCSKILIKWFGKEKFFDT